MKKNDVNIYDVVMDVDHDLHEQVHEFGESLPPRCGAVLIMGKNKPIAKQKHMIV